MCPDVCTSLQVHDDVQNVEPTDDRGLDAGAYEVHDLEMGAGGNGLMKINAREFARRQD